MVIDVRVTGSSFSYRAYHTSGSCVFEIQADRGRVKLHHKAVTGAPHFVLEPPGEQALQLNWRAPATGETLTWQRLQQTWKTLLLQLTGEVEDFDQQKSGGLRLQVSKITGEVISSIRIGSARTTTWLDARLMMAEGLRPFLWRSRLAFISPQGEQLTRLDDTRSIADVLGGLAEVSEEKRRSVGG